MDNKTQNTSILYATTQLQTQRKTRRDKTTPNNTQTMTFNDDDSAVKKEHGRDELDNDIRSDTATTTATMLPNSTVDIQGTAKKKKRRPGRNRKRTSKKVQRRKQLYKERIDELRRRNIILEDAKSQVNELKSKQIQKWIDKNEEIINTGAINHPQLPNFYKMLTYCDVPVTGEKMIGILHHSSFVVKKTKHLEEDGNESESKSYLT